MAMQNLLTAEEARQLKQIHDAVAARRPHGRDAEARIHGAMDEALFALHSIGTGGLQYAVSLGTAAAELRKAAAKL